MVDILTDNGWKAVITAFDNIGGYEAIFHIALWAIINWRKDFYLLCMYGFIGEKIGGTYVQNGVNIVFLTVFHVVREHLAHFL